MIPIKQWKIQKAEYIFIEKKCWGKDGIKDYGYNLDIGLNNREYGNNKRRIKGYSLFFYRG